jgi:hypothetical protein
MLQTTLKIKEDAAWKMKILLFPTLTIAIAIFVSF